MKPIPILIAISAMLALSPAAAAGERAKAEVACQATGEKLVYDCMIMLAYKKSGDPVTDARVVVKADMPTMPMAHNLAPVEAMAMAKPGAYQARIELQMHGEWTLTLDISGPLRDRLVKKLRFGKMGAGMGGMKHGGGMPKKE